MQIVQHGYKGLKLLVLLNWDRVLWPCAIAAGLYVGGWTVGL